MNLNTLRFAILSLSVVFSGNAQGTLQFNQVYIANASSGNLTVPNGKVWKITGNGTSGGVYYAVYTSDMSTTWSATNPNPCTGGTSGSATVRRLVKYNCPRSNNLMVVNGIRTVMENGPIWLPAGTTLQITSTPCVNTLSPNMASNTPYWVRDETISAVTSYYECFGPLDAGVVPNSIIVSIIEFNVIP